MTTPAWILDIFAALMLVVAAVSAARLVAARPWVSGGAAAGPAADIDVAHLLMAIAMAGMLTASLTTLPNTAWEVIFGLMTAWFAWRVWRDCAGERRPRPGRRPLRAAPGAQRRDAVHVPGAGRPRRAVLEWPGWVRPPGSAMQTLEYPTLAFIFALILVGYSVWDLDQLSGRRYSAGRRGCPAGPGPRAGDGRGRVGGRRAARPAAGTGDAAPRARRPRPTRVPGGQRGSGPGVRALLLSPGTTVGCRIVMGVTMAFMLVIMI